MRKGDIVLIPFPFTDLSGNKNRPAVILYESGLDILVAFVTSQNLIPEEFDVRINPSNLNGLKKPSLIRLRKLATLDKDLAIGKMGRVSGDEISLINTSLIKLLKLQNEIR